MSEQHDDHCMLTFMGQNWHIAGVSNELMYLRNDLGDCLLDTFGVRWDEYVDAACAMLDRYVWRTVLDERLRACH